MSPGRYCAPHGTCPVLAAATGHNAHMSILGRQGRACPPWPIYGSTGSTGHAQSWPRPLGIMPTCPSLAAREEHVPRGHLRLHGLHGTCPVLAAATGHNAHMSILGRQGRACPAGWSGSAACGPSQRAIGPAWPSPFHQGRRIRRARRARGPCWMPRGRRPACSSGRLSMQFRRRSRR